MNNPVDTLQSELAEVLAMLEEPKPNDLSSRFITEIVVGGKCINFLRKHGDTLRTLASRRVTDEQIEHLVRNAVFRHFREYGDRRYEVITGPTTIALAVAQVLTAALQPDSGEGKNV